MSCFDDTLYVALNKTYQQHTDLVPGELLVVIKHNSTFLQVNIEGRLPWMLLNGDVEIISEL